MRLIVGMTGATGAALGVRLLEQLSTMPEVEAHLVISRWARSTLELETGLSAREIGALADVLYSPVDEIVDHIVTRVLDQFDLSMPQALRWQGMHAARASSV